ncbi:MAG: hypothetical protein M3P30_00040 [Chloroflexota bacterium]|nr:hypothetical protein [Chloroflexota bacterium]
MAETKKGHKYNDIPGYTKKDGTEVKPHRRSNPITSTGPAKKSPPKKR